MNEKQLRGAILAALAEVVPEVDAATIDAASSFRDQVEIDSVDFLNFVLRLESAIGVHVPEVDYPRLSSLDGAVEYLAPRLGAGAAAAAPPATP